MVSRFTSIGVGVTLLMWATYAYVVMTTAQDQRVVVTAGLYSVFFCGVAGLGYFVVAATEK